ncbi:hypothetical protein COOONC_24251 [Cooperia oncophora]
MYQTGRAHLGTGKIHEATVLLAVPSAESKAQLQNNKTLDVPKRKRSTLLYTESVSMHDDRREHMSYTSYCYRHTKYHGQ